MYDYSGDMRYFQEQLLAAGIGEDKFDITAYCGLTFKELQWLVNSTIAKFKESK